MNEEQSDLKAILTATFSEGGGEPEASAAETTEAEAPAAAPAAETSESVSEETLVESPETPISEPTIGETAGKDDTEATSESAAPPDDPMEVLRQQVEQLSAQLLAAQSGTTTAPQAPAQAPTEQPPAPVTTVPQAPPQAATPFVLSQDDYIRAISSPEGMSEVMQKMQSAIAADLQQHYLAQAVQQATSIAREEAVRYAAAQQFFVRNPELTPYKASCALVANELAAQNPNMPMEELLAKTALVMRTRYGLSTQKAKAAGTVASATGPKPAFVGGGTKARSKGGSGLSPQQELINSVLHPEE